jgi:DNA topoisomerase IB
MARLRRSDLTGPGLRRRRCGAGFTYVDDTGGRVTDEVTLERIRGLVIPPAWEDVWICPWPNGHIQAVGTDAKGRRQYRYHDLWRQQRDRDKFDHVLQLARALPALRKTCELHLRSAGMAREKVLATAVQLLDVGFFRVGGEEYVEENGSYGLCTLLRRHVQTAGDELLFDYPAKSGQRRVQSVVAPDLAAVVAELKRRRSASGRLLAYRDGTRWRDVTPAEVNAYLRQNAGLDVTAKDFRTWNATVLASVALAVSWRAAAGTRAQDRAVRRAVCEVATYLGNTPTVCRTSYIDPRVIDLYRDGVTIRRALDRLGEEGYGVPGTRGAVERAVLQMLTRAHRREPALARRPASSADRQGAGRRAA